MNELMKIAEQFRAMNPPWFKAISDADARIQTLERQLANAHARIDKLEKSRDDWRATAQKRYNEIEALKAGGEDK